MRRSLAVVLALACVLSSAPPEALASFRAARPVATRTNAAPLAVPETGVGTGVFSAPALSRTSLAPALAQGLVRAAPLAAAAAEAQPAQPASAASEAAPIAAEAVPLTSPAAASASLESAAEVLDSAARVSGESAAADFARVFSGATKRAGLSSALGSFASFARRPAFRSFRDSRASRAAAEQSPVPPPAPEQPRRSLRERLSASWNRAMTDGSGRLIAAAFAWNFLTIGAYSIIGPARGALLMTKFGPEMIPWVYMASAALTGAVVYGYNKLTHLPRKKLIGGSLLMLAGTLAAGALAVAAAASPAVAFGYFLWTDVFGIMSVTLFWTYANDVFTKDESKRSFGLIAAGAPLGSIAGAYAMKALVGSMGPVPMLMVAAAVFSAVLPLFLYMERYAKERHSPRAEPAKEGKASSRFVLARILASPYLLFLTLMVAGERLIPDLTNYLYSAAVKAAYGTDATGMAQLFADVNFWTSVTSFLVSSFLTGPIIKRFGVGGSLMTAGLANLGFFVVMLLSPSLALASFGWGLDGVTRYTTFKTAKESTYASRDKDTIYRVKAFVEMFVYRFARGLAGLMILAINALGGGFGAVTALGVPFALLWLYCAWRVGREQEKFDAEQKPK